MCNEGDLIPAFILRTVMKAPLGGIIALRLETV